MLRFYSLLILAGALFAAAPAHAANFDVHPIILELSAKTGSGTIAITNRSSTLLRFHITASAWDQAEDGEMILKPTKDIVFFPAMLSLNPKESRQIRVGSRLKPGAVERAYRIFVQELPPLAKTPQQAENTVSVLTKMGLPVFLAAKTRAVTPAITTPSAHGRKVRFSVTNAGNTHMRVQKVMLTARGAEGAVHTEKLQGWYVLAGGKRTYEVELPEAACKDATTVEVRMESEDGSPSAKLQPFACQ